jgi:uncharacterized protein
MNVLFRALIIAAWFFSPLAEAAVLNGLYETEIIAQSQSQEDRNTAFKAALTAVLQRILVVEGSAQQSAVAAILSHAPQYVRQYQYALQESGFGANKHARLMRVLFDEHALLAALKPSSIKIWGPTRPETLLWLVVEDNGRRSFFKAEIMPELASAISAIAKQTGLPLLFPLLDMDEQRLISVSDVLSAYPQRLLSISGRYDVVSILAGRIVKRQNCWESDWAFYFGQRIEQWTQSCASLNHALATGMQGAYTHLAGHYATKSDTLQAGIMTLRISGVGEGQDMKRISDYLNSLAMVKSVFWLGTEGGLHDYRVRFEGDSQTLEEMLGLGRVLSPQDSSHAQRDKLRFQLLPKRIN